MVYRFKKAARPSGRAAGGERLIAGAGELDGLTVYGSYPAGDSLHPLAAVHTAHIRHIHEGPGRQAGNSGAVNVGLFHLGKARGGLPEYEHDFRDTLIVGKAKRHGDAANV